jgi:hypothetical protein
MTDDADRLPDSRFMDRVGLLTGIALLLSEYESRPENEGTVSVQLGFTDEVGAQHVWTDGTFRLADTGKRSPRENG